MRKIEAVELRRPFGRTCLFGPFVYLQPNDRGGYDGALREIHTNQEGIQECARAGGSTVMPWSGSSKKTADQYTG